MTKEEIKTTLESIRKIGVENVLKAIIIDIFKDDKYSQQGLEKMCEFINEYIEKGLIIIDEDLFDKLESCLLPKRFSITYEEIVEELSKEEKREIISKIAKERYGAIPKQCDLKTNQGIITLDYITWEEE